MAAYFDGSTSYGYEAGLLPSTALPFTLSCWIKPDSTTGSDRGLVRLGSLASAAANRECARLYLQSTGRLAFQIANNSGVNNAFGGTVNGGQWNHCLGLYPQLNLKLAYLNGTPGSPNTGIRALPTDTTNLAIGASVYNSLGTIDEYFAGAIAHVAIWDEALSTGEIVALALGSADPKTIRPNALRYYNPLVTPINAPSETVVDHAWSSWNQAKYPYINGDPGSQSFVNIARTSDNPHIVLRHPLRQETKIAFEPAAQNNSPIFYHQRQQQGMAS